MCLLCRPDGRDAFAAGDMTVYLDYESDELLQHGCAGPLVVSATGAQEKGKMP